MKKEDRKYKEKGFEKKKPYVEPKVIATYEKEELEETINSQGSFSVNEVINGVDVAVFILP